MKPTAIHPRIRRYHILSVLVFLATGTGYAQVNSGSDGSDGALNPTSDLTIDMADHPDGIYQYTSVNIPEGILITFIPNAANTPITWLVQADVTIEGTVNLVGGRSYTDNATPGQGGPGGFAGGVGPSSSTPPGEGRGPGGGRVNPAEFYWSGGSASFGGLGTSGGSKHPPGDQYGNEFLLPLIGGSGGSGGYGHNTSGSWNTGGSGGGGAILVAANGTIEINGKISANGGQTGSSGGGGSGGAIRLVATTVTGTGLLNIPGSGGGGYGRVRIDSYNDTFSGGTPQEYTTRGYQPIILLPQNENVTLSIDSIGGISVTATPGGSTLNPDVVVPSTLSNPVTIVVRCQNIPLNTEITLEAKPTRGAAIQLTAENSTGTEAESFAQFTFNLPRGAGTLQAKAITGITADFAGDAIGNSPNLAATGWLATGESFAKIEISSALGREASLTYITESGVRYSP